MPNERGKQGKMAQAKELSAKCKVLNRTHQQTKMNNFYHFLGNPWATDSSDRLASELPTRAVQEKMMRDVPQNTT